MRNGFFLSFGSLAAIAALAGCGGSSGVSSGYGQPPSTSPGKAVGPGVNGGSTMAALTVGRTWQYAVTGTVTKDVLDSAAKNASTISGPVTNATFTREVSSANDGNANDFLFTDTLTYTLQGTVPSVEVWIWNVTQNADNSLSITGEDRFSTIATVDNASLWVPGAFATSTNLSGLSNLSFTNYPAVSSQPNAQGQSVTYTSGYATLQTAATNYSQENVPTTTGPAYNAWRSQFTATEHWVLNPAYFLVGMGFVGQNVLLPPGWIYESKSTRTSVDDWVPSIGASVRTHLTLTETDYPIQTWNASSSSITYTYSPTLNKTETLDLVLTGWH